MRIYEGSASPDKFYAASQAHFDKLREVIYEILPKQLKEENAEADFHVVAWLTRIATTSGATDGSQVISSLENRFGAPLPASVKAYLEKWVAKESWSKVYAGGLH